MAGTNQHFIPQFAQAGFVSRGVSNKRMTWVYRQARDPFESNLRNVNAERFFYGSGDDRELDDKITAREQFEFAPIWGALLPCQVGPQSNSKELASLVAHFESRTRHLRTMLAYPVEQLMCRLEGILCNKDELLNRVIKWVREDPLAFIGKHPLAKLEPAYAKAHIWAMSRKQLFELLKPTIDAACLAFRDFSTNTDFPEMFKHAHNEALKKIPQVTARMQIYAGAKYELIESPKAELPLVLGDSVCLFLSRGKEYRPILDSPADFQQVVIPISSTRALVGTNQAAPLPTPTSEEIRRAAIRCSLEQFSAAFLSDDLREKASEIGLWADMISPVEVRSMLDEMARDFLGGKWGK